MNITFILSNHLTKDKLRKKNIISLVLPQRGNKYNNSQLILFLFYFGQFCSNFGIKLFNPVELDKFLE